ncbi:hypothetical protein K474DRAFT_1680490 [Panus rudis PR-1116 ss-1]|nr:hypothetical protein K474DRAFT_1680490 [Panus rudis PR-1116 ss-1]
MYEVLAQIQLTEDYYIPPPPPPPLNKYQPRSGCALGSGLDERERLPSCCEIMLLTLLNELVMKILEGLVEDYPKLSHTTKLRFISRVCQRLYAVSFPLRMRHLVLPNPMEHERCMQFMSEGPFLTNLQAQDVRTEMIIGSASQHAERGFLDSFDIVRWNTRIDFPHLVQLEIYMMVLATDLVSFLLRCPSLKNLRLIWPYFMDFCNITAFTSIERLSILYAYDRHRMWAHPPLNNGPILNGLGTSACTALRSLTLDGRKLPSSVGVMLSKIDMPTLRACHLLEMDTFPLTVFNFLTSHPALISVSVTFRRRCTVTLGAVIDVIFGEFTVNDTTEHMDIDPIVGIYIADQSLGNSVRACDLFACDAFSFGRRIVSYNGSNWRYEVETLGVSVPFGADVQDGDESWMLGAPDIIQALGNEYRIKDTATKLNVVTFCSGGDEDVLHTWGRFCAILADWRRLEVLTLYWRLHRSYTWAVNPERYGYGSILQQEEPPLHRTHTWPPDPFGLPFNVAEEFESDPDSAQKTVLILEDLGIPFDNEERGPLMEAWRRLHEASLSCELARVVATTCLRLLKWYLAGGSLSEPICAWSWHMGDNGGPGGGRGITHNRLDWQIRRRGFPPAPTAIVASPAVDLRFMELAEATS